MFFYILISCQRDVVSHVDDAEDNNCVDAFTACNPFNPGPLPQPGTVGTHVARSCHLHQSHEDMLEMRMQALLIILIAMLVLLMMVAWEHYPNSDLSKWSSLLSPCMNISHRTAICLWLYLIAEMMMLTMVMVFSARRGIQGLCCYQYLNQMLCGVSSHIVIKHNAYLLG